MFRTTRSTDATALALGAAILFSAVFATAASALNRDSDPVVMEGAQLPSLAGMPPGSIVAFRHETTWIQIPVQVDERTIVDYGTVYNAVPLGLTTLSYADNGTFVGPDPDATFDADDELVFMARDAGPPVPAATADPAGVVPGTRVAVRITDPLDSQEAFVYLFQSQGTLVPDAGADYVTYSFNLFSGPYLTTYNTTNGPNPENSEVVTAFYRTHFSDRWIRDETNVFAGGATGVDILDRHKNLFAPTNCSRSEDSFSAGEGAFFANKDGPVRAIRSYMGANSGPLTQRVHRFYERRHDVTTHLRVHIISGVMDFYDYSPAASGMTYTNDLNTGGVTVDGVPDAPTAGQIVWEMVTGAQGTLVHANWMDTDIPGFAYTSYYLDAVTPPVTQCTGDAGAYGSSGPWINQVIPNTDPLLGPHNQMASNRVVYSDPPNQTTAVAALRYAQATTPLVTTVSTPTGIVARGGTPAFRLEQNAPNPFSRTTRIAFATPPGAPARIRIYDVRGRLLRTIEVDRGQLGRGSFTWDRTSDDGNRVGSGIYFYRLEAPGFSQARKLVVLE